METIRSAPVVKLEYTDQSDHQQVFVDDAGSTASIVNMDIQSSQNGFSEEWLYLFTYNPTKRYTAGRKLSRFSAQPSWKLMEPPILLETVLLMMQFWIGPKVYITSIKPIEEAFMKNTLCKIITIVLTLLAIASVLGAVAVTGSGVLDLSNIVRYFLIGFAVLFGAAAVLTGRYS